MVDRLATAVAQSDLITLTLAILNVVQTVLLAHISSRSSRRRGQGVRR